MSFIYKLPLSSRYANRRQFNLSAIAARFHIDMPLMLGLAILVGVSLLIQSSTHSEAGIAMERQGIRLGLAFVTMLLVAQIKPHYFRMSSPWLFGFGLVLLAFVLVLGDIGKGAQRWLDLGLFRFQPAEIMKLAVPMMLAYYISERNLPPKKLTLCFALFLILIPTLLIAKQPDLGTALLVATSGCFVLFLAGTTWRLILGSSLLVTLSAPVLWFVMRDYQRQRVLTFLNPENDPLGSGYHIIQSKIAIGSGGFSGKGWLQGTQSNLQFLPERSTDFIFAVMGEEFGLIGAISLLIIYAFIIGRCLYISVKAQDTFSRLLSGSITLTFFVYIFVNIGMVIGLLPVVGVPLPLISYGGTSMVTLMIGFGILMSVHTHRKLMAT